jgi:GNAT superfamily N-acetyltransferase
MSLRGPEPLGSHHRLDGFDCGKPSLNDWLLRHARHAQGSGSAKTFVVADDDRAAGYFSLTVGQIDTLDAPERIRKGMGQYPVPVVILARLAVSQQDQGRGVGFGLLQDAIRRTMLIPSADGVSPSAEFPQHWLSNFAARHPSSRIRRICPFAHAFCSRSRKAEWAADLFPVSCKARHCSNCSFRARRCLLPENAD